MRGDQKEEEEGEEGVVGQLLRQEVSHMTSFCARGLRLDDHHDAVVAGVVVAETKGVEVEEAVRLEGKGVGVGLGHRRDRLARHDVGRKGLLCVLLFLSF